MFIYYCITIIINFIFAVIFHNFINITALSLLPLFFIALMVFQAIYFKNEKVENGFRTMYRSNLTENEENDMFEMGSKFLFATIPWMIPFIIFFPSFVKLFSVLVYIIGLIGGLLIYKFKNKGNIMTRINAEEKERIEQEKKEHLGNWK